MPEISSPEGFGTKRSLNFYFQPAQVSELVGLNRDQVNLERREFGVIGKGRRPRVVFLSDTAAEWLGRYIKSRDDDWKPMFIRYPARPRMRR